MVAISYHYVMFDDNKNKFVINTDKCQSMQVNLGEPEGDSFPTMSPSCLLLHSQI